MPVDDLPRGLLIGTVEITGARRAVADDTDSACVSRDLLDGKCVWELTRPHRFEQPHEIRYLPYGVWFYPYRRKSVSG